MVAIALVLWTGVAAAGPPVVVTGDADADEVGVTDAVRDALAPHVELVDDPAAAAAVVSVEVKAGKGKKKWTAKVSVRQAPDGKRLGGYDVKAARGKLAKAAAAKAWKQLKKPIGKAKAPAPPEPEPVAEAPREASPPPPVEEDRVARVDGAGGGATGEGALGVSARAAPGARGDAAWLTVAVTGRPQLRTLRYRDDLADTLRAYDLAAPAARLDVAWRPARAGALRHLAVRASYEQAVGVNGSRTDDGMEFATSASEWTAGVRGELPVGGARLALDAGYGEQRFTVDDDAVGDDLVPDVTYRYVRGALGLTVPVGDKLAVDASAGYRYLVGTGDLGSDAWFPRQTGAGVDAAAGVRYAVAGPVELHAGLDLRRYFFAMNPEPGDPRIAGGAVDQYVAVVGGLAIALR